VRKSPMLTKFFRSINHFNLIFNFVFYLFHKIGQ
jgi:hypothetical protein